MANPHLYQLLGSVDDPRNLLKRKVASWVGGLIDRDTSAGRYQSDFPPEGLEKQLKADSIKLKEEGVDVFQGGGNIFHVIYKFDKPVVVHSRPLAQRVVRLQF